MQGENRSKSHTELNPGVFHDINTVKNILYTVDKTQRSIHFDKIDRILKVSKNLISQNYKFKTHAKIHTMNVVKMHVIKIQSFVLNLILLPRIMPFFKPEVLKNGMKFKLRKSI